MVLPLSIPNRYSDMVPLLEGILAFWEHFRHLETTGCRRKG